MFFHFSKVLFTNKILRFFTISSFSKYFDGFSFFPHIFVFPRVVEFCVIFVIDFLFSIEFFPFVSQDSEQKLIISGFIENQENARVFLSYFRFVFPLFHVTKAQTNLFITSLKVMFSIFFITHEIGCQMIFLIFEKFHLNRLEKKIWFWVSFLDFSGSLLMTRQRR